MKIEKTLVAVTTYNAPHFLEYFIESIERFDAGYPYDLLIVDSSSDNLKQRLLLDKLSKKYDIKIKPNVGRAQGGYRHAFNLRKNYLYYFFLHDDSCFIRDNWLLKGVERINDSSFEKPKELYRYMDYPVGKVGYQSYEWGTIDRYLRTGHPAIFRFLKPLIQKMKYSEPIFQHINDDRTLFTNKCIQEAYPLDSVFFKIDDMVNGHYILNWFQENYPDSKEWESFQTVTEYFNDVSPILSGFRTHNLIGDGYSQEELGWDSFWGNEYVAHFGAHNVFKRLGILLNIPEEKVRESYKNIHFLRSCANIIKKDLQCQKLL
jgi:glycosyltransferase involved in cell wall biosynthesis